MDIQRGGGQVFLQFPRNHLTRERFESVLNQVVSRTFGWRYKIEGQEYKLISNDRVVLTMKPYNSMIIIDNVRGGDGFIRNIIAEFQSLIDSRTQDIIDIYNLSRTERAMQSQIVTTPENPLGWSMYLQHQDRINQIQRHMEVRPYGSFTLQDMIVVLRRGLQMTEVEL